MWFGKLPTFISDKEKVSLRKRRLRKWHKNSLKKPKTQINPRKNEGDHYCFYRGKKAIALLNYVTNLVIPNGIG